jgi:hypothetical protein
MHGGNQALDTLTPELLTTAQAVKLCWRHAHSGNGNSDQGDGGPGK